MGRAVRLELPADPDLVQVARLTAIALANEVGVGHDGVDGIRIAVDELCLSLLRTDGDAPLRLTFDLDDDRLVVSGERGVPAAGPPVSGLVRRLLDELVDDLEIDTAGERQRFRFTVRSARRGRPTST